MTLVEYDSQVPDLLLGAADEIDGTQQAAEVANRLGCD